MPPPLPPPSCIFRLYTHVYKDIHVRTHTNAKRVDFKIAAAAAPRRPHKLPARAFSIPAGYPKDRVPTAPKHAGDEGKAGGVGGRGESGQSANRFLRPTLSYPWRACPSAGGRAVDVSLRRDRGRFSLNLASPWTRAYLNEPATIEITKPRFCTQPDTTRFLRC